jgi:DNA-binding response OmpR family regulator
VVHADPARLDRMLFNLLSNAFKFTDTGAVTVSTRRVGEHLELAVADTGIGLAAAELPRIFTRFTRAAGAQGRGQPGSGIGLAIVDQIVKLHGGEVLVESQPGKGTRFVVTLPMGSAVPGGALVPVAEAARARDPDRVRDEGETSAALDRLTEACFDPSRPIVLCVEDDADLRGYLRDVLGGEHNVFVAEDGVEGLEKARRYLPDLIVTDQTMPRMDGRQLLAAVRGDRDLASIPVAFLTARHGSAGRIESLDAGADDYVTKPFHEEELRARARNLIRAHARERELGESHRRLELRVREQVAELVHTGELRRFLPRAVVETLARGAFERGRSVDERTITLLVAEVAGLATSSQPSGVTGVSGFIDEYLEAVAAIAAMRGGTIDSFAAGRVSMLFGAPEPASAGESAWAAVEAAFELHAKVVELAAAARRRGVHNEWRSQIGIATGRCLVGAVGGDSLRAFTAIGAIVEEAARLAHTARPGVMRCAASTCALVKDRVRMRPLSGDDGHELVELATLPSRLVAAPPPRVTSSSSVQVAGTGPGRVFRREGDYWTIAYGGSVFRLHDVKGLEYLARLLERPDTEIHVLDLVAPLRLPEHLAARTGRDEGLSVRQGEDAGAMLDLSAKTAYRNRLRELDEELAQAKSFSDEARAGRIEQELEVLARELSAAVGLGGRDRRAASVSERARVNVARAIKSALSKIALSSPHLERHLRVSIRTGTFCSYSPHPGVLESWDMQVS